MHSVSGGKIKVAVIFGGSSVEHEISVLSAISVISELDTAGFGILPVFITRDGSWHKVSDEDMFNSKGSPEYKRDSLLYPSFGKKKDFSFLEVSEGIILNTYKVDVVFPVLHGTNGEDGTVQGLFELMDLPYVGSSVLGASISMDKIIMKSVLRDAGLPVLEFTGFSRSEWDIRCEEIKKEIKDAIGLPCFVKSADLGSSVGISRAVSFHELDKAVEYSLKYSNRVLVERAVNNPREIEVSVLGIDVPESSSPGEVIPGREFYDYQAKYLDSSTQLVFPADIEPELETKLKSYAERSFIVLDCSGMGRVDFLIDRSSGDIFVSEMNTIPGFTSVSMYPKLWEISGLKYGELLNRLIEFAFYKYDQKKRLETSVG